MGRKGRPPLAWSPNSMPLPRQPDLWNKEKDLAEEWDHYVGEHTKNEADFNYRNVEVEC